MSEDEPSEPEHPEPALDEPEGPEDPNPFDPDLTEEPETEDEFQLHKTQNYPRLMNATDEGRFTDSDKNRSDKRGTK